MKIGFVSDSISDIPDDLVKKFPITIVPEIITISSKEYIDGVDLSREDFYKQLPDLDPPPTTAAPAPSAFEKAYKKMFDKGIDHIFSIHTTPKISNIHNSATLAANNFPGKVEVIDSLFFTLGLGFQVLAGAEAADKGKSVDEVRQVIEDTKQRTRLFALLHTLENLKRSGRVSWLQAGIGELLQLKMIAEVKDGEVQRHSAARTWNKALNRFQEIFEGLGRLERLAILHAGAEEEARAFFGRLVAKGLSEAPIFVNVTTVIGTHVGVNAIGFAAVLK